LGCLRNDPSLSLQNKRDEIGEGGASEFSIKVKVNSLKESRFITQSPHATLHGNAAIMA
jgi:hypothetical protein